MNDLERRFECPFGCCKGLKRWELIRHLARRHTAYAVAQKLVEILEMFEDSVTQIEEMHY